MIKKIRKIGDIVVLKRLYKDKINTLSARGIIKTVNINNGFPLYTITVPKRYTTHNKVIDIVIDNTDIWRVIK